LKLEIGLAKPFFNFEFFNVAIPFISDQGDQIGRFVAYWTIVCLKFFFFCFKKFFLSIEVAQFWGLLFPRKVFLMLAKNGLGYILVIFFANASGYPVCDRPSGA
jgi:hypothetical protein